MINKVRSTHKELTSNYSRLTTKALGFTMAEILLSLTIIGVVAAITLPSLTGNINERTWNTQRKALYARMSQAIALMPTMNNYGSTVDNHAETFITSGLSKVLKINNICSPDDVFDCGFASKIIPADGGSKIDLPRSLGDLNAGIPVASIPGTTIPIKNTKAAAFETANGEAILTFYNPNCTAANVLLLGSDLDGTPTGGGTLGQYTKQQVCANFVFDLNGKKGPNTVGKDIGMLSVLYSSDPSVVMPMYPKRASGEGSHSLASSTCQGLDEGQYRLPNVEEVISIYYNSSLMGSSLFGTGASSEVWTATSVDADKAYTFGRRYGIKYPKRKRSSSGIVCVQR